MTILNIQASDLVIWGLIILFAALIIIGTINRSRQRNERDDDQDLPTRIFPLAFLVLCMAIAPCACGQFLATHQDKIAHFGVGSFIGTTVYCTTFKCTHSKRKALAWSLGTTAFAGAAKEIHDWQKYNAPRREMLADFSMTMLGGLMSAFTIRLTF